MPPGGWPIGLGASGIRRTIEPLVLLFGRGRLRWRYALGRTWCNSERRSRCGPRRILWRQSAEKLLQGLYICGAFLAHERLKCSTPDSQILIVLRRVYNEAHRPGV